eukprot:scaffold1801_cov193-Ochromonas_danica.AAC.2
MADSLTPIVRHLKPPHPHSVAGVDTLTVTPADQHGNKYIIVVVNHFTKFVGLYPTQRKDAETVATALFQHFCRYGVVDCLASDPGTEFMNQVVSSLLKWFGIRHRFSLVDRHESNGVEGTNKLILRHLKALVFDERVISTWSEPTVLPLIQYILNSTDSSETGVIPMHAHFGTLYSEHLSLPTSTSTTSENGKEARDLSQLDSYVQQLDRQLKLLQDISRSFQLELVKERTASNESTHHLFQQGDFVLFWLNPDGQHLPTKLSPRFAGPFKVLSQYKNDVQAQHLSSGEIKTLHVSRLKLFHGSAEDAFEMAMLDKDQYLIQSIEAYRGDPLVRTTMEFEIQFADGTIKWLPYSTDIYETVAYEDFCRSRPELALLVYPANEQQKRMKDILKQPITTVIPGDEVYVDLRWFNHAWYDRLPIPDREHSLYVLKFVYGDLSGSKAKSRILATCTLMRETYKVDNYFVQAYGSMKTLQPHTTLVDESFCVKYPDILPRATRSQLLQEFKRRVAQQPITTIQEDSSAVSMDLLLR